MTDTVTFSLVGFVIVIAIVVVWRVVIHDRSINRIRFGVFWERERDDLEDDEPVLHRWPRRHDDEDDDP